jgi:hypothetical protein
VIVRELYDEKRSDIEEIAARNGEIPFEDYEFAVEGCGRKIDSSRSCGRNGKILS